MKVGDWPALDEEAAYQVQDAYIRFRKAATGRHESGYKLGMTSPETQALAGARKPAYGTLTDDRVLKSPACLDSSSLQEAMAEPEVVFIVRRALGRSCEVDEVLGSCDVAPGIEVPDSRFKGWFARLPPGHIVCDNAVSGYVIVGDPVKAESIDLRDIEGRLYRDGRLVAAGRASKVMGHPAAAVSWLVKELARRGRRLSEGMILSSGALAMPVVLEPGIYRAVFAGLGDAYVSVGANDQTDRGRAS